MKNLPAARGTFVALLAALLFGASTPLVQRVGVGVSAWMTAAMLYAGAAAGAVIAFGLGERGVSPWLLGGAALMLAGVVLHIAERHEHEHEHETFEHEHAHDDGHHDHVHAPMPVRAHSHRHTHEAAKHSHPHTPDLHHVHKH